MQISQEVAKLRAWNKKWEKDFFHVNELRTQAQQCESKSMLYDAIDLYIKSVKYGLATETLNIHNYAYDIDRLSALCKRTHQIEIFESLLNEVIAKYPDYKSNQKWESMIEEENNREDLASILKAESREMEMQCFAPMLEEAETYETNDYIPEAVSRYLIALEFAENECRDLLFSDYVKCITQIILLYNSSGQYLELRSFVNKVIDRYPDHAKKYKKIIEILDNNQK